MPQVAATGLIKALIAIAINYVIARVQVWLQKKPVRQLQKVDVNYQGALEPRRRLYGYFRAGGLDTMPAVTSGPTGGHLHRLITLSDGEIQAIDAVWFNNDRIDAATYFGGPPGGAISTGPYGDHAYVGVHTGTPGQVVDSFATSAPGWGADHLGSNIAYCYFNFLANNTVYPQGAPNVLAEGRGAKVYDPRLDTSPGANPTTSTYFAFTTNPALILADFLRWVGESASSIDWSDVVSCANSCDGSVTIPNGSGGTTTQSRFTCSVEVFAPQSLSDRDATIAMLVRAMLGACWYSGGKWQMAAGVYSASVGTILDDDFLGETVNIQCAKARASGGIYNKVRGSFTDQVANTQPNSFPEIYSTAYETEDGGESIPTDAEFKTARTAYEAQRNAILILRQSRNRTSIAAQVRWRAAKFNVFDVVTVTCAKAGWTAQTARITRMKLRQDFTVEVQLQKIASTDFTDPITADYTVPGAIASPTSVGYSPSAPRNLAAQSQASGIIFTWDAPLAAPVGVLYRLKEYTSSTPYSSATQVSPDTAQNSIVLPKSDTTLRYYWITAVDPVTGSESTQAPSLNGVPGGAASASSALSAIVYPGSATVSGYTSTLTTPTVAVTPTGGTPGYTYATTVVSGGAGITVNNGTTAAPSFSAAGLVGGDVKSGTYRIRVTDSVAATYDVNIAVTITCLFGVTLNNTTITATGGSTSPAVATYTVSDSGDISPSPGTNYQWKNPSATASDYDVRFTLTSGALYSGTTVTWLQLTTARMVQAVRQPSAGAGTSTTIVTVEIRDHNTLAVLATKTLTMNCTI